MRARDTCALCGAADVDTVGSLVVSGRMVRALHCRVCGADWQQDGLTSSLPVAP